MSRETILILLGVAAALLPWIGIPLAWLSWLYLLVGVSVVAIGVTLRRRTSTPSIQVVPQSSVTEEPQPRSARIAHFN